MSFAGYFLSVLFCLLSMLISDSRFDLVWFRLSCDHGWIRSGSVNVRKQQQQQYTIDQLYYKEVRLRDNNFTVYSRSVLVAKPKKLQNYTIANPACGLLNRGKEREKNV